MKTPNDGKFPVTVSEGGVSAKIHKVVKAKNGKAYTSFVTDYILLGKRKQVVRAKFDEARQVALNACRKIASGQQISLTLSNHDRLTYLRATEALAPSGIALDVAVTNYIAAVKNLPVGTTLKEAIEFFCRRSCQSPERKSVQEVVVKMLEIKRAAKLSEFHLRDLSNRLKIFADSFAMPIRDVTGAMIQAWLDKMKVTPRTKQNYLRIIATLFRFAIRRKYLPKEAFDEIEAVQLPKLENKEAGIFTPTEMQAMLNVAHPQMVLWLAIGGFAGLRSAEIHRLDWSEINLKERHIEIKASKAKTAARRIVPITDNLAQWLTLYAKESGKVIEFVTWWKQVEKVIGAVNTKRQAENQFTWKRNGLRHSFCSYRLAAIKNAAQVALEAGNSPQMIFKHYRQVVTESEAAQWFAIVPEKPSNVVTLPDEEKIAA